MRDSFVFYRSFAEAISKLKSDAERLAIYEAIIGYALDDKNPALDDVPAMAFTLIKPQIDANNTRYENGKKGGRPKTKIKPNENQNKTNLKPNVNENVNVNVNENENVKEKLKQKEKRFTPPTLEEARAYFTERGYPREAEAFINFYESKGWMVGKNKMKDWRAAVRNWTSRDERKGARYDLSQRRVESI